MFCESGYKEQLWYGFIYLKQNQIKIANCIFYAQFIAKKGKSCWYTFTTKVYNKIIYLGTIDWLINFYISTQKTSKRRLESHTFNLITKKETENSMI